MRDFRQLLNGCSMRIKEILSQRASFRHLCDTQPSRIGANSGKWWREPLSVFATSFTVVAPKASLERATRIELAFSACNCPSVREPKSFRQFFGVSE